MWLGLGICDGEESIFVSGVKLLELRSPPKVDIADCWAGALNTEETVLV